MTGLQPVYKRFYGYVLGVSCAIGCVYVAWKTSTYEEMNDMVVVSVLLLNELPPSTYSTDYCYSLRIGYMGNHNHLNWTVDKVVCYPQRFSAGELASFRTVDDSFFYVASSGEVVSSITLQGYHNAVLMLSFGAIVFAGTAMYDHCSKLGEPRGPHEREQFAQHPPVILWWPDVTVV